MAYEEIKITPKTAPRIQKHHSPVFTAANNAKKPIAYMIDFFLSNLPGRNIQAVAGCTMKT